MNFNQINLIRVHIITLIKTSFIAATRIKIEKKSAFKVLNTVMISIIRQKYKKKSIVTTV